MKELIKIQNNNLFLLNTELLGLDNAELWIGPHPDGPMDNDDTRVLRDRAKADEEAKKTHGRISGISAVILEESKQFPGWFEINTTSWVPGIYRFNLHGKANIQAPNGGKINPSVRDWQYSWPNIADHDLMNLSKDQQRFLYRERNNAGYCFRVEKNGDGTLLPAGDGLNWISNWPEVKKNIEEHNRKKVLGK